MKEPREYSVGVVGAGSWGTTLACMLAEKGCPVTLWVYEPKLLELMHTQRCNCWYLPDMALPAQLHPTGDLAEAVSGRDVVLWVTPVKAFRECFARGSASAAAETIHVSCSKGIEIGTLKTISQIAAERGAAYRPEKFVVLSGPSFAADVCAKTPTAVVAACTDPDSAAVVQQVMVTPFFRTYTTEDVRGVELGGALKNVMAIASGIIAGLGLGHNTQAALITRGLAEMIRLGSHLGAQPRTFAGLSGMGDLVLTCTSSQSRNYRVGKSIGEGRTLTQILDTMKMVAEGVHTTRSAQALSRQAGVDMPIVAEIYQVLFEEKNPREAVRALMSRDLKQETV